MACAQCGKKSSFFIINSHGTELDFVAFGVTMVRAHLPRCSRRKAGRTPCTVSVSLGLQGVYMFEQTCIMLCCRL